MCFSTTDLDEETECRKRIKSNVGFITSDSEDDKPRKKSDFNKVNFDNILKIDKDKKISEIQETNDIPSLEEFDDETALLKEYLQDPFNIVTTDNEYFKPSLAQAPYIGGQKTLEDQMNSFNTIEQIQESSKSHINEAKQLLKENIRQEDEIKIIENNRNEQFKSLKESIKPECKKIDNDKDDNKLMDMLCFANNISTENIYNRSYVNNEEDLADKNVLVSEISDYSYTSFTNNEPNLDGIYRCNLKEKTSCSNIYNIIQECTESSLMTLDSKKKPLIIELDNVHSCSQNVKETSVNVENETKINESCSNDVTDVANECDNNTDNILPSSESCNKNNENKGEINVTIENDKEKNNNEVILQSPEIPNLEIQMNDLKVLMQQLNEVEQQDASKKYFNRTVSDIKQIDNEQSSEKNILDHNIERLNESRTENITNELVQEKTVSMINSNEEHNDISNKKQYNDNNNAAETFITQKTDTIHFHEEINSLTKNITSNNKSKSSSSLQFVNGRNNHIQLNSNQLIQKDNSEIIKQGNMTTANQCSR